MTMLTSVLLAASILSNQGSPAQGHGTVSLGGRVISIQYPSAGVRQVPDDVKAWDGFQGIAGQSVEWPTPFIEQSVWKPVADQLDKLGPVSKEVNPWRVKVVLVTSVDALAKDGEVITQNRSRLSDAQVDATLRAIARVPGLARAETDGAVSPQIDLTIEPETLDLDSPNWLSRYIGPRFNRGRFDADDKEFRGPYRAVIVLHPGLGTEWRREQVGGQSVVGLSVFQRWSGAGEADGLEAAVTGAIAELAESSWQEAGIYREPRVGGQAAWNPHLYGLFDSASWEALNSGEEPNFAAIQVLYKSAQRSPEDGWNSSDTIRKSPFTPNVALSIVDDATRGRVLRYGENATARRGGFALPFTNVDPKKTPYLTMQVKSDSGDPLEIRWEDHSSLAVYPGRALIQVPNDKAWHTVTVDLSKARNAISDFYVGPEIGSQSRERHDVGEIVYYFDDFKLTSEGAATSQDPIVSDEVKRARGAKTLSAAELAKDSSDLVKLNGLLNRGPFAASDEAGLIELSRSVNPRISALAVAALGNLDSATAKAEVLRLATSSPFEATRRAAALSLGKIGDPKTAGPISRLFANRSWQSRLAGAQGLTMIPGDEAAVISMTFLQEIDPEIRLAVTENANVQNPVVQKRLLWSAVNDPSDSVRAMSCWKLIKSGNAKNAAEGYKGVKDDSFGVRRELVDRMGADPSPAHRNALRIAVTDLSPSVRAAALRALATQPGPVTPEEVANVFEDKFPVVQLALLDLAKAKSLALPKSALTTMKASIDARVVQRAQEIDG
jgi:HEAT repeat protein